MATLIPVNGGHPAASGQSSNVEATYEDMFKEITRKLYGEETGNGLHTLGTPVAQVATSGPTAVPEGEQRSFTNLQQLDRSAAPSIEYESSAAGGASGNNVATTQANVIQQQQQQQQQAESGNSVVVTASSGATVVPAPSVAAVGGFKSEDHLSTAFGLAALMQNGFAAGQAGLLKAGEQQQRWAQDGSGLVAAAAAEPQLVQWTSGGKLQSYAHVNQQQQQQQQPHQSTPKSKKHRQEHAAELIYASPSTSANAAQNLAQSTPTSAPSNSSGGSTSSSGGGGGGRKKAAQAAAAAAAANGVHIQKRYACTHCPYSTDRRDLYTRHENIHKDEKPFQCYACLKQFNRADHVKKHFLRMHRELQYDINKTRRHVSAGSGSSGSGSSGGGSHHSGGRGNVTINSTGVNIDNAFLEAQRHPTSTSMSIVETIEAVASATDMPLAQLKQEKMDDGGGVVLPLHVGVGVMQQPVASSSSGSSGSHGGNGNGGSSSGLLKPKREKRFTCCYCPWSGADKWGLKRHLNTHTKPFVCLLCDYKAARSERLATHVLKVHNKRACSKCSYLADTQEEYQAHMSDVHPHDNRPARSGNGNQSGGSSSGNSNGNGGGNGNNNANAGGHSHSQNLNVLRTIGNSLVANNQLNTYAGNAFGSSSGNVGNANGGGGAVTIYTTTTNEGVAGGGGGGGGGGISGNISGGGPLQEIIVNPSSMVGWRLSANGSLIPPHDLLTGGLPNAATQKRGSERLFQYLEAEGSDPEDYARLLKMDAISRNTASVAQDFHKAGGVHELKIPANHQLLFNNKLPSQWTTREAAALLYSLSNMGGGSAGSVSGSQRQKFGIRARQHSTGEDDENTPSSASSSSFSGDEFNMSATSPLKLSRHAVKLEKMDEMEAKDMGPTKAMMATAFLEAASYEQTAIELLASKRKIKVENDDNDEDQENQQQHQPHQQHHSQQQQRLQLIKSSPAYKLNNNNNNSNSHNNNYYKDKSSHRNAVHHHRQDDKENNKSKSPAAAASVAAAAATSPPSGSGNANQTPFLTQMEYQNLNRIGTQFQNYVKDIINKYYAAETPLMLAAAAAALPTATTTGQQQQQAIELDIENMSPSKRRRLLSETEEYIEYLRNKEDITLTIAPKIQPPPPVTSLLKRQLDLSTPRRSPKKAAPAHSNGASSNASRKSLNQLATLLPLLADAASQQEYLAAPLDFSKKSSSRKQAQPKKIRLTPEAVVTLLRDKYLNRMVRQRLGCIKCNQTRKSSSISFNYHTLGSLALHKYWRHGSGGSSCSSIGRQRLQAALQKRIRRGQAERNANVAV
ncbi:protein charlatan isoform X1 [Drosophila rhopaloa]|uniref:Protein charlatan isoform X1 n=1 Tax=Drosophila rhopaloa TaxID=1041015 RepID=A0A6P4E3F3_DRORH|nr:protein charlatan isoform X1 [Drosophila rhopaloa]XP_016972490.1 protein charlatan isoform X1 [Drosophila rhopaloa]